MSDAEETTAFDEVPDPPALYITIRFGPDLDVEMDVGALPYASALGLLRMALAEFEEVRPEVLIRSATGVYYSHHVCDEDCEIIEDDDE